MKTFIHTLLVVAIFSFAVVPSRAGTIPDQDLTKQIVAVLKDINRIKPGMTRAELDKVLTEARGGLQPTAPPFPFQQHQIFFYRRCDLIYVEVDFKASDSKDERPTDIISKISKPCLGGWVSF